MKFGSVCSGIEAASVAWHVYGWEAAWFAEVDRAASDVLAHRFPDVANHGDMTLLAGMVRRREISAPDALVGGTPCQSFSVAGLRGGLSDARGQLTLAFVDLADAIDEIRIADGLEPVIIVWENVPGVLTHSDNPLGCFLGALAGDDDAIEPGPRPESARSSAYWTWDKKAGVHRAKWPNAGAVAGPQRSAAWVVKDAQYFGLAQRRRRVFVVASSRQGFDPAAVLLEFDGVRRDSAPRRETQEDVTHAVAPCLVSSGRGVERTGDTRGQDPVVAVDGRLRQFAVEPVPTRWDGRDVSQTLDAVLHKGQTMPEKNRFPAVLHPIHIVHGTQDPCVSETTAFALGRNSGGENVIAFTTKDYKAREVDVVQPLMAGGPVGGNQGGDYLLDHVEMAVRRLMPVECERLQGFPDNWTLVPTGSKGKPAADGPRYKQCGNSMATNVMRWIGGRIVAELARNRRDDFDDLMIGHNGGPTLDDDFEALL